MLAIRAGCVQPRRDGAQALSKHGSARTPTAAFLIVPRRRSGCELMHGIDGDFLKLVTIYFAGGSRPIHLHARCHHVTFWPKSLRPSLCSELAVQETPFRTG